VAFETSWNDSETNSDQNGSDIASDGSAGSHSQQQAAAYDPATARPEEHALCSYGSSGPQHYHHRYAHTK
jgi:hypothetical protein